MSSGPSGARFHFDKVGPPRDLRFSVKGSYAKALAEAIIRVKAAFPEYSEYKTAVNQPDFAIEMVDHYRKNGTHHFHYRGLWVMFVGK